MSNIHQPFLGEYVEPEPEGYLVDGTFYPTLWSTEQNRARLHRTAMDTTSNNPSAAHMSAEEATGSYQTSETTEGASNRNKEQAPRNIGNKTPATSLFSDQLLAELSAKPLIEFHLHETSTSFEIGYWTNADEVPLDIQLKNSAEPHQAPEEVSEADPSPSVAEKNAQAEAHLGDHRTSNVALVTGAHACTSHQQSYLYPYPTSTQQAGPGQWARPQAFGSSAQAISGTPFTPFYDDRRPCPFCRKNGEAYDFYTSHELYQRNSNIVTCPVLRKFVCKRCGVSGDYAHTDKYCPWKSPHHHQRDVTRVPVQSDGTPNKRLYNRRPHGDRS